MVNFMLCIFYHTHKLHISIESFRTKESRAADMWHGPHSDLTPPPPFPSSFDCDLINFLLFKAPSGSDGKESTSNAGDLGSIPGSRRSPGGGHFSCLENPHGQNVLVGYRPWGCKESDMTE